MKLQSTIFKKSLDKRLFINPNKAIEFRNECAPKPSVLTRIFLADLRNYYKQWKPKHDLFESPDDGHYSGNHVLQIIKTAAKEAGLKKRITPPMLRHHIATHLLEYGIDLRYIQVLLGHSSTKTTEIHTQVATNYIINITSPIDTLP